MFLTVNGEIPPAAAAIFFSSSLSSGRPDPINIEAAAMERGDLLRKPVNAKVNTNYRKVYSTLLAAVSLA